ncbi:MAG TPA: hypothetical protein VH253_17605 [Phycisphaerae bacterium]|nr:hypothetical protein [Phycisphaerae bacterium]
MPPPLDTPPLSILAENPPTGFPLQAIAVHITPDPAPLPEELQQRLDEQWTRHLAHARAHGKVLFDAPILCLHHAQILNASLHLHLIPSTYKRFLITALRDRDWFLQHNAAHAIHEALGNSALLTSAHPAPRALLGIRSPRVSAYPNRAHLLGGALDHFTPDPANPASPAPLIHHLQKELLEETSLTPADLPDPPRLLALVRDNTLGQPELIWHWPTTADLDRLAANLHPHEHAAPLLLSRDPLSPAVASLLTPVAQTAIRLWHSLPPS